MSTRFELKSIVFRVFAFDLWIVYILYIIVKFYDQKFATDMTI